MAEDAGGRRFAAVSALRELRLLAGLLKPGLAALLDPSVAGQHAAALELRAQRRIDLGERLGDSVPHGRRLAGDPATVDADPDVNVVLITGLGEGLLGDRLQIGPREVVLELAPVDLDAPASGPQDHASHR